MSLNEGMRGQYAAYRTRQYGLDRTHSESGVTFRIAMTKPTKPASLSHPHGRLRWARERRFATAADFCRAEGLAEGTYRHHENGNRKFRWEWALRYSQALGVDAEWLLAGGTKPDTKSQKDTQPVTIAGTDLGTPVEGDGLDMNTAERLLHVMKELLKSQQIYLERSEVRYEDVRTQNEEILSAIEKLLEAQGHAPQSRRPKPRAEGVIGRVKPS
jgi:hypothetical protein